MDLLLQNHLSSPDLRDVFSWMWSEMDLFNEGTAGKATPAAIQNAIHKLAGWIQSTTASRPTGAFFEKS